MRKLCHFSPNFRWNFWRCCLSAHKLCGRAIEHTTSNWLNPNSHFNYSFKQSRIPKRTKIVLVTFPIEWISITFCGILFACFGERHQMRSIHLRSLNVIEIFAKRRGKDEIYLPSNAKTDEMLIEIEMDFFRIFSIALIIGDSKLTMLHIPLHGWFRFSTVECSYIVFLTTNHWR